LLFAPSYKLGDGKSFRLLKSNGKKPVSLVSTLVGAKVVAPFKINRINPVEWDELLQLNVSVGFRLDRIQLGLGNLMYFPLAT
jgi:hypothetical protein